MKKPQPPILTDHLWKQMTYLAYFWARVRTSRRPLTPATISAIYDVQRWLDTSPPIHTELANDIRLVLTKLTTKRWDALTADHLNAAFRVQRWLTQQRPFQDNFRFRRETV